MKNEIAIFLCAQNSGHLTNEKEAGEGAFDMLYIRRPRASFSEILLIQSMTVRKIFADAVGNFNYFINRAQSL